MRHAGQIGIGLLVFALSACAAPVSLPKPKAPLPAVESKLASTEFARDLIDGRIGVLFHVRRFRFHPAGGAIGALGRWGEVVEALGLDPLADVDRAFITAFQASDFNTVNVMELNVSDERVRAGFRALGGSSTSAALKLQRGPEVFVALVGPHRLVAGPKRLASRLWVLAEAEPLPLPEATEAARFFAFEPYATLGGPPSWPSTLLLAQAELEIERGGGATIRFEALSSSPSRAPIDANMLTAEARRLLAVDMGLFDLELLKPPVFYANGRRVVMKAELAAYEVDWVIRFSGGG